MSKDGLVAAKVTRRRATVLLVAEYASGDLRMTSLIQLRRLPARRLGLGHDAVVGVRYWLNIAW
jgi:hypothetical protein